MIIHFITGMIIYSIILTPIYIGLRYLYIRRKQKLWWREFALLLFVIYCISIFSQTIVPSFSYYNGQLIFQTTTNYSRSNYIPFTTILMYVQQLNGPIATIAFYNLVGNIILFIPFGFFIPLLWKSCRSKKAMLLLAILIPIFIESTQYYIGRSTDIDDVILNAFAIYFGYIVFVVFHFIAKFLKFK